MRVLLVGNTGYITKEFVQEAFPESEVFIMGNSLLKTERKKHLNVRPFPERDEKLLAQILLLCIRYSQLIVLSYLFFLTFPDIFFIIPRCFYSATKNIFSYTFPYIFFIWSRIKDLSRLKKFHRMIKSYVLSMAGFQDFSSGGFFRHLWSVSGLYRRKGAADRSLENLAW